MSNQITAGPWSIYRVVNQLDHDTDKTSVVRMKRANQDEIYIMSPAENHGDINADAAIIAAAPEIYEALKQIINRIEIYNLGKDFGYEFHFLAKEAIAKATPQEPAAAAPSIHVKKEEEL